VPEAVSSASDPGLRLDAEDCVLPLVIRRRAEQHPDRVYAIFEGGESWTYAEAWEETTRMAAALREHGVAAGDFVLSWQPNGPDAVRTWLGINQLGAVYVPINTAYRGMLLEHVIENSGARLIVLHPQLLDLLDEVDPGALEIALATAPVAGRVGGTVPVELLRLPAPGDAGEDPCPAQPWDPYAVIYTSGTTGPSKGVLSSYAHLWASSISASAGVFDETDRYLVHLPLFHGGGTIGVALPAYVGGSMAVVESFSTARFWDLVRELEATSVTLLGVMTSFLSSRPPSPADTDHTLRSVYMIPLDDDPAAFAERFGVGVYTLYNMTETSCPIVAAESPPPPGICGRPREGVEVRLVDEHDHEVPPGAVGELIVRSDRPWTMMTGYNRMPDATASAWRNGWLHTGDAFRRDDDGNFVFVDRLKDAIRRRGENISSFEVEAGALAHPAVQEAAAVAVASELSEDEVLLVVAPAPGQAIDPEQLHEHCARVMPHFMAPRYIRVLAELPKTATSKVEKHRLREEGITADSWNREDHGIAVKRRRLEA
jgi:crotonobetaine/carnitine-CoA ligase